MEIVPRPPADATHVWRPGTALRVFGSLTATFLAVVAVFPAIFAWPLGLLVCVTLLGCGAYVIRVCVTPYIAVTPTSLVVQNEVRKVRIARERVEGVSPGYWGLAIATRDGEVLAVAVGKSELLRWLNRRGRADSVGDELMAAVRSS